MKFILVVFVKKNLLKVFCDTLHKARVCKNLCVTKQSFGKIFCQKCLKKSSALAPKTEDFFWIFSADPFNGYNNKISNFILGYSDLKLNC